MVGNIYALAQMVGSYWPQGAPCNVCEPDQPIFGTLNSMKATHRPETIARGIRNTWGLTGIQNKRNLGSQMTAGPAWRRPAPDELNYAPQSVCILASLPLGRQPNDPKYGNLAPKTSLYTSGNLPGPHVASWACGSIQAKFP